MSNAEQLINLTSFNGKDDCNHTVENRSILEGNVNHLANDNESALIHPSELTNKDEPCNILGKSISTISVNSEENPEISLLDMGSSESIKDGTDKISIYCTKSSSSGTSSMSTFCSVHSQPSSKQNSNSSHCSCHQYDNCSRKVTSKFSLHSTNHNGLKQKSLSVSNNNNSEQFFKCGNENNCLKCFYLETEVAQLKDALDDSKKKNKKLKNQLEALQNDLVTLKHSRNLNKRKHSYPGMVVDIIGEIYAAQRERDEAIMSRIHLANDERDVALDQLEELKEKYYKLASVQHSLNKTFPETFQRKTNSLETAEEILKNKHLILEQISLARQKDLMGNLDYLRPTDNKTEEVQELESEIPLNISQKVLIETPPLGVQQTKTCGQITQIELLQRRLLDEMGARQQAEENCQKLEKLVSVLKRKVNGLILGHPLMSSSVDSFPVSPVQIPSAEGLVPEASTPVAAKLTPDSAWEDRTVSYA